MDYRSNEDYYRQDEGCGALFNAVLDILFIEGSSAPIEPVTYEEAIQQANIDDLGQDRSLVEAYITTARMQCEGYTGIGFIARTIQAQINNSLGSIYLPYGPIGTVTTVKNEAGDDQEFTILGVQWKQLKSPAYRNITVTYTAGYTELPEVFKTAILQQVAYLYEHRGDEYSGSLSMVAKSLLQPHRRVGL
jgi:hypothetical protein